MVLAPRQPARPFPSLCSCLMAGDGVPLPVPWSGGGGVGTALCAALRAAASICRNSPIAASQSNSSSSCHRAPSATSRSNGHSPGSSVAAACPRLPTVIASSQQCSERHL